MPFSLSGQPFLIEAIMETYPNSPAGTGWQYDTYQGSQLVLTFSFSTNASATFRSIYLNALGELSSFVNVNFVQVADQSELPTGFNMATYPENGPGPNADLRFSQQSDTTRDGGLGGAWFWNTDSDSDMEDIDAFNQIWTVNHYTILHEMGHAFTLLHTTPGATPDQPPYLLPSERNNNYTVMHYTIDANNVNIMRPEDGEWDYRHFQLYDVYALQLRFGINQSTYAGNTVHTAATLQMDEWLRVLWDASGTDTIDMSAQSRNQRIDIRSGAFSDVGSTAGNNPTQDNLAIAIGAVIENASGGGGADSITGSDFANILVGNGGSDQIFGLGGNDTITGGTGNDVLNGGSGDDSFTVAGNADGFDSFTGGDGFDTVVATANNTVIGLASASGIDSFSANGFSNIVIRTQDTDESFNFTGAALVGLAGIYAGLGNDSIVGSNGTDSIFGEGGNDILNGGLGISFLDGGSENDRLILGGSSNGSGITGGAGFDVLEVTSSTTLGALSGIEALELSGGAVLTLSGSLFTAGFDPGLSISGNGSIVVNLAANETFAQSSITLVAGSTIGFTVNGSTGTEVIKVALSGLSYTINGGGGTDQIRGGNLADVILGGDGNDKLLAVGGADIITGGTGADQFRYLSASDSGIGAGADIITDFATGQDRLDFRLLDSNASQSGVQVPTYIGTSGFSGNGAAQIRWTTAGADLRVEVDVDGNGLADMHILLQGLGGQTLTQTDFLLA